MSSDSGFSVDTTTLAEQFKSPVAGEYTGYSPKTDAVDYWDEDNPLGAGDDEEPPLQIIASGSDDVESPGTQLVEREADPDMVKDAPGTDGVAAGAAIVFTIACIVFLVMSGLGAACKLGLCEVTDVSSNSDVRPYSFATFDFAAPLQYIHAAAAAACLGIAVLSVYAFQVIKKDVGSDYMVEVATYIREGAHAFLLQEYIFVLPVVVVLFALIWIAANWRVALCYLIGAALSALTGWIGMSIATRGNVRTTAAAQQSLGAGLNTAFKTGAVMGLSVVSLGLGGVSISYLLFRDVRALVGFAAGASTIALFARVAGGIFTKAADVGADMVGKVEANIPEDDPRNPATIADNVGDNVGDVAGMGADLFESYVGSIVATAVLGASLPYFSSNPYAMCVYNHLYIDKVCISADQTNPSIKTSLAGAICRQGNLFLDYPDLEMSESNSLFIALPFMIGVVGILASILCTAFVSVPSEVDTSTPEGRLASITKLLRSLRTNVLISTALVLIGSAALCFGMFGPSSKFQKALEGPNANVLLERYTLASGLSDRDRCLPTNLGDIDDDTVARVPRGRFVNGHYMPMDTFGRSLPSPPQTPWRLFLCILLGLVLGIAIGALTEYFTAGVYTPTRGIAAAGEFGAGSVIIKGMAVGFLSTALPLLLVMSAILIADALYRSYGIALTAVGMLSTLGVTMATDAYGPVADNAGGIAEMAELPSHVRDTTDALDALGNATAATGKGFSNGSAILTAYALVTAMVQESSLVPSPRDLVGSASGTGSPVRHISDSDFVSLIDINVISGTFIGALLPFVFGAMTLIAVSRAAQQIIAEVRRQFRDIPGLRDGDRAVRPDHKRCIGIATKSAILEMVAPGVLAIMAPLVVGFGLGQRALIGMLIGAIGSGYMLGIFMSNAGGAWDNAKKLVEAGEFGEINGKGSAWHRAVVAGDTVGDPFKDTSGPAMNILIKMMAVFALIAVPHMQPGTSRGWIGIILLIVTMIVVVGVLVLSARRGRTAEEQAAMPDAEAEKLIAAANQEEAAMPLVSPFYAGGPEIPKARLAPSSLIGRQYRAIVADETSADEVARVGALALPALKAE